MSRYKAYPEYKDSGVDWFDSVPEQWDIKRISYVSQLRSGDAIASDQIEAEGDYPVYGGNGLRGYCPNFNLDGNFILIGRQGALCGNINYGSGRFWASEHAVVVYPSLDLDVKWLGETLRAMNLNQYNVSAAQPGLAVANIVCLKIPFPPKKEQELIAAFLNHETAKIDALIEKQQRLIELLKEKRQAVISHAVTKGLNPKAPMKDSDVEWLGEVPAHWEVKRMKYSIRVFEQGWSPQCDSRPAAGEEFGVLKVGCVNGGVFNAEENKALPSELIPQTQYLLKKGDFLISRANTRDLVGSAAVIEDDFDKLILCDKLYRLRFSENINPYLVSFYLSIPSVRQQIELGTSGASDSMQNISQSVIKELQVLIPPVMEAELLVNEIKNRLTKFDEILSAASQQIAFLQERRTALISAAVTGKIDVRDWQVAV